MEDYNCIGVIIQPFYANVLFESKDLRYDSSTGNISGSLSDVWGPSMLRGKLDLPKGKFEFEKEYLGRPAIRYTFERSTQGLWVGRYVGEDALYGESLCELFKEGEKMKFDWKAIAARTRLSSEGMEIYSRKGIELMIKEGKLKLVKDPKTGEDMVELPNEGNI